MDENPTTKCLTAGRSLVTGGFVDGASITVKVKWARSKIECAYHCVNGCGKGAWPGNMSSLPQAQPAGASAIVIKCDELLAGLRATPQSEDALKLVTVTKRTASELITKFEEQRTRLSRVNDVEENPPSDEK